MFFEPAKDGMKPPPMTHNLYAALVTPRPIGWISTVNAEGVVNLAPYSFFNAVAGDPPCVMFSANGAHQDGGRKDSLLNAEQTGEFVYNLCDADLAEQMNATSEHMPRNADEMRACGLDPAPSRLVKPPRVRQAKLHLECVYLQTVQLPTGPGGTENFTVFGQVVGVHIADEVIVDGMVDFAKLNPLARLGYLDYSTLGDIFSMKRPD